MRVMILLLGENHPIIVVMSWKVKSVGGDNWDGRGPREGLRLNVLSWPKRWAGGPQRREDYMERRSGNPTAKGLYQLTCSFDRWENWGPERDGSPKDTEQVISGSRLQPRLFDFQPRTRMLVGKVFNNSGIRMQTFRQFVFRTLTIPMCSHIRVRTRESSPRRGTKPNCEISLGKLNLNQNSTTDH